MAAQMARKSNIGMVCESLKRPAAITAKAIMKNGLNRTGDRVKKPAGDYKAAERENKADKAARLENRFVGIAHVSSLHTPNMRSMMEMVNG